MDPKLLAEIEKTVADARHGYNPPSYALYAKHIDALLEERRRLLRELDQARAVEKVQDERLERLEAERPPNRVEK